MKISTNTGRQVIVIGAGPAGLSAAYCLSQQGYSVLVLEASPYLGGLARSFNLWGQTVDTGPHRFISDDPRVNRLWQEVIGDNFSWVNRITRIYYRGQYFFYPLVAVDVFRKFGKIEVVSCLLSYFKSKFYFRRSKTLEDWIISRFGRKLFEIFFKSYSEKLWGLSCDKIDASWAAQRIKKLSLLGAIISTFLQKIRKQHRTLATQFAYPKGGSGMFYIQMAERIRANNGEIRLEAPVELVLSKTINQKRTAVGVQLTNGNKLFADIVISTMPITVMVRSLGLVPDKVKSACDALKYRNTILVYLELDSESIFPDNWIYVHSAEVLHGRITNFRNWCPSLFGDRKTTIICMEYWCFDEDVIWSMQNDELIKLARFELDKVLPTTNMIYLNGSVMKLHRSYPIYELGYKNHLSVIQQYVDETSRLLAIGRYGSFKYNNQDHSLLMGILAAEECVQKSFKNHWEINEDFSYQENTKISD